MNSDVEKGWAGMENFKYYLPGIVLFLLAFVVLAVPEILVAFVAALIIMAGIGALYIGHLLRRSKIEFRDMNGWFSNNGPHDWRCVKESIFRRWH